jgi:hypothetical protein
MKTSIVAKGERELIRLRAVNADEEDVTDYFEAKTFDGDDFKGRPLSGDDILELMSGFGSGDSLSKKERVAGD